MKVVRSSVLLLKEGNKVFFNEKEHETGPEREAWVVSDGSKTWFRSDTCFQVTEQKTTPDFKRGLVARLASVGLIQYPYSSDQLSANGLEASDFSAGKDDAGNATLTYRVKARDGDGEATLDVTLWYDPATCQLHKRTVNCKRPGLPLPANFSITEVYDEFTLDADMPNSAFVLPAESNDDVAAAQLKGIAAQNAMFQANDLDRNGKKDYWVGDVSGLYRHPDPLRGGILQLVTRDVAEADALPLKTARLGELLVEKPKARQGYFFTVLKDFVEGRKIQKYDDEGTHQSLGRFGFSACPAEYPKTGKWTFIISEKHRVYRKDTAGKAPETFPEDPREEGWEIRP